MNLRVPLPVGLKLAFPFFALTLQASLTLAQPASNVAAPSTPAGAYGHTVTRPGVGPSKSLSAVPIMLPVTIPLFLEDSNFKSTLVLVNGGAAEADVDITVRSLDGMTSATDRVHLLPRSQRQVSLPDIFADAGVVPIAAGSILLEGAAISSMAANASLSLTSVDSSNFVDEEIVMPARLGSSRLRAVANHVIGSPLLAIASLSAASQQVSVRCTGAKGFTFEKTLTLPPNATLATEACVEKTFSDYDLGGYLSSPPPGVQGALGIEIVSDGLPGSFAAFGLAPHLGAIEPTFGSVPFVDPESLLSSTFVFTGVPVGSTPQ